MVIPMKAAIGVLLLVSVCAFGQQAVDPGASSRQGPSSGLSSGFSGINLFGGYSFTSIDTNGLDSRQSANGWEASVATRLIGPWALEAGGGGYYKTVNAGGIPLKLTDYSVMAGPRCNFPKGAFAHALIGMDRLQVSSPGLGSDSQNGFAAAFGGGVQLHVTHMVSFRTSADYLLTRHNIFNGGNPVTQNNFRVSVGPVFTFGGGTPPQAMHDSSSKPNRHHTEQVPDWWTNPGANAQK
jgi:Outer membrane protein beta-barrel domain